MCGNAPGWAADGLAGLTGKGRAADGWCKLKLALAGSSLLTGFESVGSSEFRGCSIALGECSEMGLGSFGIIKVLEGATMRSSESPFGGRAIWVSNMRVIDGTRRGVGASGRRTFPRRGRTRPHRRGGSGGCAAAGDSGNFSRSSSSRTMQSAHRPWMIAFSEVRRLSAGMGGS